MKPVHQLQSAVAPAHPSRPATAETVERIPPDQARPNQLRPGQTVAVALSGGLDSTAAALRLKERGHRLVALHMLLRPGDSARLNQHVRPLAARLAIPLHTVDLCRAFHEQVITPFLEAYTRGRTPNPCVDCNPRIKFSLLREHAVKLGARWLATGHYARLIRDGLTGRLRLFRARNCSKDQSYFLSRLSQAQLAATVFPLGDLLKSEVRQLAAAAGITGSHREESQEICFVPDNDYRCFLEQHLGRALPRPGPILDLEGRHLGEHGGIHRFTIGQRRGLGIPSSAPYYVVGLEPETHTVRVGRRSDLDGREMLVTDTSWIAPRPHTGPLRASVQIRSRHREAPALLEPDPRGLLVRFLEPQAAITPGQTAVFYDHEEVLGGGTIDRVIS
jgi:tRNA-specific 2-thiouridylase